MSALHDKFVELGLESPFDESWRARWKDASQDHLITTQVPIRDFYAVREKALLAHATQIDPDGPWFGVPLAIQQAGWPTEDYQLVVSKVPTMIPEDDLFAGLRPEPLVPEFVI